MTVQPLSVNARTSLMHDSKYETNYAPNVTYIQQKYVTVNTILNNICYTTKTVQKLTKPSTENNRATNWKKRLCRHNIQRVQSVRRNIITQNEKSH